jgi:ABC-type multidrug transport system ATPase subunit
MEQRSSTSSIEAHGLEKTYPGDVRALDGLSFDVAGGSIFGLLGPNGAGKSTTVKILTTLSRPDAGSARVAGRDVLSEPDAVRRAIGVVAQKSGVDREATGRENLVLQGQLHGMGTRTARARADELLARFGLEDKRDAYPDSLSGGQQQRVAIVRALALRPKLMLLDEITSALDPELVAEVLNVVRELAQGGMTMLIATHEMVFARDIADRVCFLDEGVILEEGPPDQIFAAPREPRTKQFLARIVEAGRL